MISSRRKYSLVFNMYIGIYMKVYMKIHKHTDKRGLCLVVFDLAESQSLGTNSKQSHYFGVR